MNYFEVILGLICHGREIGRTCVQLSASSQFTAAVEAEQQINGRYGKDVYSHTVDVHPITEEEFIYVNAA